MKRILDEDATTARNTDDINIQETSDVSDVVSKNTDELRGLHYRFVERYLCNLSNPPITYADVRDPWIESFSSFHT